MKKEKYKDKGHDWEKTFERDLMLVKIEKRVFPITTFRVEL